MKSQSSVLLFWSDDGCSTWLLLFIKLNNWMLRTINYSSEFSSDVRTGVGAQLQVIAHWLHESDSSVALSTDSWIWQVLDLPAVDEQYLPNEYNIRWQCLCCIRDGREWFLLSCPSLVVFSPLPSWVLVLDQRLEEDVSDVKAFERPGWDSSPSFWELLVTCNQGAPTACRHRSSNQFNYQSVVNCYQYVDF